MFLGNESKLCECRANVFFWRIRLANLSGPTPRLPLSVWFREQECRCKICLYFYYHALRLLLFVACPRILIASVITLMDWPLLTLLTSHIKYKRVGNDYLTHYWMQVVYPYIHNSAHVILFPITLYFYFDDWHSWSTELIDLFCRH